MQKEVEVTYSIISTPNANNCSIKEIAKENHMGSSQAQN